MRNEIQQFLDYVTYERKYSNHTILAYAKDLETFRLYLEEIYSLNNIQIISHFHVRSWLTLMHKDLIANSTIKRKMSSLKSFFKFLLKQDLIKENPMEKVIAPKVNKSLPKFVDQYSLNELIDGMKLDESCVLSVQRKLIFLTFYHTGIRRAELINLKESDVNFANNTLKVMGKGGKERIIPFATELAKEMASYLKLRRIEGGNSTYVFSKKNGIMLDPKYVYTIINEFLKNIGVASQKSPHVLRHSYATNLLRNGADLNAIKELLGHASLNATQIYTQNSIEELKNIHKLAHPKS